MLGLIIQLKIQVVMLKDTTYQHGQEMNSNPLVGKNNTLIMWLYIYVYIILQDEHQWQRADPKCYFKQTFYHSIGTYPLTMWKCHLWQTNFTELTGLSQSWC